MTSIRDFDVAVLGGGPGGYAAALRAARRGASVCCIEAGILGGTCLNVGCIPSKAMLHASELAWHMRHASQFGLSCPGSPLRKQGDAGGTPAPQAGGTPAPQAATPNIIVDAPAFMARVNKTVSNLVAGLEGLLKTRKVEVIRGFGRMTGRNEISIWPSAGASASDVAARYSAKGKFESAEAEVIVRARSIILATGSRPARPAAFPWGHRRLFTTDEAAAAGDLPHSVIIVGGGSIGCEFATIYSELGIRTIVVEMLDRLASKYDAEVGRAVARSLAQRGVEVLTGQKIASMIADDAGVRAQLQSGRTLEASAVLVAVGRPANIEGIGLEALGVAIENGLVKVDDACRTNIEGIYAVGDMAVGMQFAHLATRMGLVAADNATGHAASDDRRVVPTAIYTHPEVAAVGLGEAAARAKCPGMKLSRFSYRASGMAQAYGEVEGQVKIMGDPHSGEILGGLVIGPHATDVIQELALAMRNGLSVEQVAQTIHPHPTFVEAVGETAEAFMGLPLHGL